MSFGVRPSELLYLDSQNASRPPYFFPVFFLSNWEYRSRYAWYQLNQSVLG